ncbi:CIC11C00000002117 [Sungouiella intermedia]|uniref:CIC11C00000002117 n=1 Tax=Sungouiella intermedia TaxID=45354 RepID=A0A1L0G118_9ASCO|nr:CIC11C00000002117 [[Candida] intermedia]
MHEDHLLRGSSVSPIQSLIAGSISGAVARAVTAPLDTIKIRLQLVLLQAEPVTGSRLIANILRSEGVGALWKGNVPAEFLYILYGASQFTSYSMLNENLGDLQEKMDITLPKLLHLFLVGCGSGVFSTFITYPFDLLRTRLAANDSSEFLSMTRTCKEILNLEGIAGFYAGIKPSMLSIVTYSGFFFCTYSLSRDLSKHIEKAYYHQIWGVEAVCGSVAGATSKAITFPLDTIRKRLQVMPHSSAWSMLLSHWKLHGVIGFYRGFGISLLKTAPTSALSISVYEYALRATQKVTKAF